MALRFSFTTKSKNKTSKISATFKLFSAEPSSEPKWPDLKPDRGSSEPMGGGVVRRHRFKDLI